MDSILCPICGVECTEEDPETGDKKCPDCGRVWYETGNPDAPLASRGRAVRLKKMPEEGDRLDEVIEPA